MRPPTEILSRLFFATDTSVAGVVLARHELVDEAAGRVAAAGDQLGADAVPVDRRRGQRRDGELVEVAGDHDPGVGRAELVELLADPPGGLAEVAGVDPDGAELGPGDLDAEPDRLGDVVGVDEQRGAAAERLDLARGTRPPRCRAAA